jgi:hypothetical protein
MAKTIHEVSAPSVANSNFKLKPALITMVQAGPFCGKAHEDANGHLQHFLEILAPSLSREFRKKLSVFVSFLSLC